MNVLLSFVLVDRFDVAGLGIASAASCTVNGIVLIIAIEKGKMGFINKKFLSDMAKIALSTVIMVVMVKLVSGVLPVAAGKLMQLCVPIAAGVVAVSYTHLDVYKRQNMKKPISSPKLIALMSLIVTVRFGTPPSK